MKKFRSKIFDTFFENQHFRDLVDFRDLAKKMPKKIIENFSSLEIFMTNFFFRTFFLVFVNYIKIAFQQAIGYLLSPSGHRERVILILLNQNTHVGAIYFNFVIIQSSTVVNSALSIYQKKTKLWADFKKLSLHDYLELSGKSVTEVQQIT